MSQARKPFLSSAIVKRSGRLRPRSKKMAAKYRQERVPLVKAMLDESPWCEVGPRIGTVAPLYRGCTLYAIGLHELRKRSQGGSITDISNVVRTCAPCNSWVEEHPNLAHEAGLVIRRGD